MVVQVKANAGRRHESRAPNLLAENREAKFDTREWMADNFYQAGTCCAEVGVPSVSSDRQPNLIRSVRCSSHACVCPAWRGTLLLCRQETHASASDVWTLLGRFLFPNLWKECFVGGGDETLYVSGKHHHLKTTPGVSSRQQPENQPVKMSMSLRGLCLPTHVILSRGAAQTLPTHTIMFHRGSTWLPNVGWNPSSDACTQ